MPPKQRDLISKDGPAPDQRAKIASEIRGRMMAYGNASCLWCGKVHPESNWIREDLPTRFKLLRFAARMMAGNPAPQYAWNRITKDATGRELKKLSRAQVEAARLGALRSTRGGLPLNDTQQKVVAALSSAPDGRTAAELWAAVVTVPAVPVGDLKARAQAVDAFTSKFLVPLVSSRNLTKTGAGDGARFVLNEPGDAPPEQIPSPEFRVRPSGQVVMAVTVRPSGAGEVQKVSADTGGKFMLGILVTPEKTFIAASGPGLKNSRFRETVQGTGYVACTDRAAARAHKTIYGANISPERYQSAKAEGASDPGNCAAPRLLEMAFEDAAVSKVTHPLWRMSEMWYLPDTKARTREEQEHGLYWTHGVTAESCKTCERLLPLLMCPYQT